MLILGIGPSLSQFFSGSLSDPTLELYQGDTLLQMNDNWKTDQRAEVEATHAQPSNDLESAIVRTLNPGATPRSCAAKATPPASESCKATI